MACRAQHRTHLVSFITHATLCYTGPLRHTVAHLSQQHSCTCHSLYAPRLALLVGMAHLCDLPCSTIAHRLLAATHTYGHTRLLHVAWHLQVRVCTLICIAYLDPQSTVMAWAALPCLPPLLAALPSPTPRATPQPRTMMYTHAWLSPTVLYRVVAVWAFNAAVLAAAKAGGPWLANHQYVHVLTQSLFPHESTLSVRHVMPQKPHLPLHAHCLGGGVRGSQPGRVQCAGTSPSTSPSCAASATAATLHGRGRAWPSTTQGDRLDEGRGLLPIAKRGGPCSNSTRLLYS